MHLCSYKRDVVYYLDTRSRLSATWTDNCFSHARKSVHKVALLFFSVGLMTFVSLSSTTLYLHLGVPSVNHCYYKAQWRRQGGGGGVPGVLAPLDQAPRTTKIDLYKYKWWHICSFTIVTRFFKAEHRLTYVSRWSTPSTYHRTGW